MRKYDQTREITLFIEKLRNLRNITQNNFLHDIVSLRQYRRYLNGDSVISYTVLNKLAKRLGFELTFIISELDTEKINQTKQVNDLYNLVSIKNYDRVDKLLLQIDERHLISDNNRLLYEFSLIRLNFFKGKITESTFINKTKQLIDYEELIKKKVLQTSELLALVSFLQYDSFKDKDLIENTLTSFLDNNIKIVSGHNIKVIAFVLAELSRYYSIIGNYSKMLYYADEAIKYSNNIRSSYILDSLYYLSAAALHELGSFDERDIKLFKCLSFLLSEGNNKKYIHYSDLFKEYFDVDSKSLILNNINKI